MSEDKKNEISIEYLVDLLSGIKSALTNINSNTSDIEDLISDLSENFTVLSALSQRQYQDNKQILEQLNQISAQIEKINSSENLNIKFKKFINRLENQQDSDNSVKKEKKTNLVIGTIKNIRIFFENLDGIAKSILGVLVIIIAILSLLLKWKSQDPAKISLPSIPAVSSNINP